MYLLFETRKKSLHYGAFTEEAEVVYDGSCDIVEWTPKIVQHEFSQTILSKLRSHGKVFTSIGLILPYATLETAEPLPASPDFLRRLATTPLRQKTFQPIEFLYRLVKQSWPHLPIYFLSDSHLTHHLDRSLTLLPFPYDEQKKLGLSPALLQSYGHQANRLSRNLPKSFISLYIGDGVSLALFDGEAIRDATVSFSPLSKAIGLWSSGSFDPGLFLDLGAKRRLPDLITLFTEKSGLLPMIEMSYDLDTLLQIAGLVPRRKTPSAADIPLETIEWIELGCRSFIRQIQHYLGGIRAAHRGATTVVINTSIITEDSVLWKVIFSEGLADMRVVTSSHTLLQAASHDLIQIHKKQS